MERLWYLFSGGDSGLVKRLMDEFEKSGVVKVPTELANKISAVIVDTFVATDDVVKETMKTIWTDNSYYVCPHTAIAVAYHLSKRKENPRNDVGRICIATASVAKFQEAVKAAGLPMPEDKRVKKLLAMETRYEDMEQGENWEQLLRDKIISINEK